MERKLAAILAADVVGYSAMMSDDEDATLDMLRRHREEVFDPAVARYKGRIIKLMGDGALVEFASVLDAVNCALDVQKILVAGENGLSVRIGIHLGDVIADGDDVYGHGVNIAARLEALAPPGGICVSAAVYDSAVRRCGEVFSDAGTQRLKNIPDPVQMYCWPARDKPDAPEQGDREKPSVAVLPFANQSGDPAQDVFCDGMAEDIITGLARFRTLIVAGRNSSFQFRGGGHTSSEIADKLGVQYLLEGSVRKAGDRVRISVQLIATRSGHQIWAERYDRNLNDIFEVQDDVARSIIAVLPGRVQHDVADHISIKPTDSMKAYELLLRGKALRDGLNAPDTLRARGYFERALALDPGYARAYMYLADTYVVDLWLGLADEDARDKALDIARKGAAIDNRDVFIQDQLGYAYLCAGLWEEATVQFTKTLDQIVNEAESMAWCGYGFLLLGAHDKAADVLAEAMRLDPLHPPALDWIMGQICFFRGDYDGATSRLMGEARLNSLADAFLAASYACSGRDREARAALQTFVRNRRQELESRDLDTGQDDFDGLTRGFRTMWRREEDWAHLADGLRVAGLQTGAG